MKRNYAFLLLLFTSFIVVYSCSKSDDDIYIPIAPDSPVSVDLTKVPYAKLSDYKFFEGDMKDLKPALGLLPFEPASVLFSDYASKKRFVWMPKGKAATYNSDKTVLELPVGAALVKSFYYTNVQNMTPVGGTRIIETRVMIRKTNGWMFADYVWNADQTEAFYDLAGSTTNVSWKDANNVIKSANYRIPSEEQCNVCHKSQQFNGTELVTTHIPIGIKPQNLNFNLQYETGSKNQLAKWIEVGYLKNNFTFPTPENSVINYMDASKSLQLRVRSYVDANCSHCHMDNRHCDYRPMRFAFSETGTANGLTNMGVCVEPEDRQDFPVQLDKIVSPGDVTRSMLYYRINTTDESYRMPLHGRTIIHEEGVALIHDWINSLQRCE